METIKVGSQTVQPLHHDWQSTVNRFEERTSKLPAVLAGAATSEQSMSWLDTASKLYPANAIDRLLHQVSGFGAKDIRTLIAHERKEYYPDDSAGELYDRKMLNRITAPNGPSGEREKILTNVTRAMLLNRYGLDRNVAMERSMAVTDPSRKAVWLVGNPGMVGVKDGNSFIYDIQFDSKTNDVNQGDLIRLHFYDLVANTIDQQPKHLSLVKVAVDPAFADSLVAMSRVSKNAEKAITQMAADFASLPPETIDVQVHEIEKQPELYREIISVGQKHWSQMLAGNTPQLKVDPPLTLDGDKEQLYVNKAKMFLAANQIEKAAEAACQEAKNEFVQSMRDFDVSDNFMPPYVGALLRKADYFDAEAAADFLEKNIGIDPAHIRAQDVNVELLQQAYAKMGGDLSAFYEYGTPDKKSIETVAEQVGLDLTGFYTRQMRAIVNPKTRGPIRDAINDIRASVSTSIQELNKTTAKSAVMDDGNLLSSPPAPTPKQAAMKVQGG